MVHNKGEMSQSLRFVGDLRLQMPVKFLHV